MSQITSPATPQATDDALDLAQFFPYRLAILANEVSHCLAQLYADRFALTRQEWRIIAVLGTARQMAGAAAARTTGLDKMQVSRAVARLERDGLIGRAPDPDDRRNHLLHLTAPGRALYRRIAPLALARERYILESLPPEDRAALDRIMDTLLERARELQARG